jgi:hypothetical protein
MADSALPIKSPKKRGRREVSKVRPEKFLELMKDPKEPHKIRDLIEKCGISSGSITYWRRNLPGFDKDYREALAEMKTKRSTWRPIERHANFKTGWEEIFLEYFTATGRQRYSATMAGVGLETVLRRVDPVSATYDPDFHEKYKKAQDGLGVTLEDKAFQRALEEESDVMLKTLLAAHLPDKYGKKIEKTTNHYHLELNVLEERGRAFLESVFQPVIEAEIVRNQQLLEANVERDPTASTEA